MPRWDCGYARTERFASARPLNIKLRVHSSTEKEVFARLLIEKRGRLGWREALPRFSRLSHTCRWVKALPNPACESSWPSELDLNQFNLIMQRPLIFGRLDA
jgi:hypothetical protein